MNVLLIKLTSLGDLIHALPALTDAYRACPGITFDWMIDESFQEVGLWHPAVRRVFVTNHRKWRKTLFQKGTLGEIFGLVRQIRETSYDLVLDGQGNFKSALFSLFSRGVRVGFDRRSVREPIAHLAYQRKYPASRKAHAIDRLRQLFAQALGYPCPTTPPDFFIQRSRFIEPKFSLPKRYLFFVHNASWQTKLWPEDHWIELIRKCVSSGYEILLPWGNRGEKERSDRLAIFPQVHVLPKLSLSEIGFILEKAEACVSMDTGLSHLAAALQIPTVILYGATDSGLIGSCGDNHIHIQSKLPCAPCNQKKCRFPSAGINPPCLGQIHPELVFAKLQQLLEPIRKL